MAKDKGGLKTILKMRDAFVRRFLARSERAREWNSDGSYFADCWHQGFEAGRRYERKRAAKEGR